MTEIPNPMPDPAMNGQQQVAVTPLMLLQPCPVIPATGVASGSDGKQYVIDRYETPVGSFGVLLDPDTAIAHGEELIRRGKAAGTGLTLPPNVRL